MKLQYCIIAATLLSINSLATAGTVVCSGTVATVAYHSNQGLMVRLSSMNTEVFVCDPDKVWSVPGTSYTTGPETCKAIYSTFLTARSTGLPINSVYFDGDDVPATCNGWASWKYANIRFYKY